MTLLLITIGLVLVVSALCSLTEAALYAVRVSYVQHLAESGSRPGRILTGFKSNMERPIAAILIINTIANTAGATVAGAQAELVLGHSALFWFSAVLTLSVLIFSEILPKILGVAYSQTVARHAAFALHGAVVALGPVVGLVQWVSRALLPKATLAIAPEEEVERMARISADEGSILPIEAALVKNVLKLNEVTAQQIMTPRSVVADLEADQRIDELPADHRGWAHARLPVRDATDGERWIGVALRRDILSSLAFESGEQTIEEFSRPLHYVPFSMPGHMLLKAFLEHRSHLFAVVDERGLSIGVVTLEDVLESLVGAEIVDEVDVVVDMQQYARDRMKRTLGGSEMEANEDQSDAQNDGNNT
ncbi:MAG: CNNM domain-containing protein [Phycisphaerales bacterium]